MQGALAVTFRRKWNIVGMMEMVADFIRKEPSPRSQFEDFLVFVEEVKILQPLDFLAEDLRPQGKSC